MSHFQNILKDIIDTRLKSDLSNLAEALLRVDQDLAHLAKRRDELSDLRREIEEAAAERELHDLPEGTVRKLYERAQGYGGNRTTAASVKTAASGAHTHSFTS